ncbi:MAG: tetratricopeptide repeat protein [Deltaproteobacteria bacterium]|nr:tetratricopeptide repeat protein [Deltaproteobacteria bacterium]
MTSYTGHDRGASRDKAFAVLAAVLPALLTFIVYLPALNNGFVDWDDHVYIVNTPNIRALDLAFFKWVFSSVLNSNWHPITVISWAVDYALWGLDPRGFHLTSIALHAINTLIASTLVTWISALYTGTPYAEKRNLLAGAIAALLFGLHPYHVESVAWVSERKDLLCQVFYFLSVIFYLRYATRTALRFFYYAASFFFLALALMSKPMAVSLPLVLLLLDFSLPGIKKSWKTIADKVPFAVLSAVSSVITISAQKSGGTIATLVEHSFFERAAIAFRAYAFYLYKTLLPVGLSPYYPFPPKARFFDRVFFLSLLIFIGISAFCIVFRSKRHFLSAWLFFIITLAPVIGIVQVGGQAAADRYTYLPSMGPFILLGAWAAGLAYKNKRVKIPALFLVMVVAAAISYGTLRQIPVWRDTFSLWSKVIDEYPGRAALAYYNRGVLHNGAGRYDDAIADFDQMLMLKPDNSDAYYNRALAFSMTGRYREAVEDLTKAIGLRPEDPEAYNNRGGAYVRLGDYDAAVSDFKKAIELDPSNPIAYQNLRVVYSRIGSSQNAGGRVTEQK